MGMRKANIVCTIGPASESPELLDQLIESGMNVARLNFSHGSHESHGRAIKAIRAAAARRHVAVAIIQDLQGPRIPDGQVPTGGLGDTAGALGEWPPRAREARSFVRAPEDVAAAKKIIAESGADVPVIARVERPGAIACLESLLDQADGVMIAPGDLGVEMGREAVPVLQKRIIAEGSHRRRLVITATQMLESMTQHPRPTRAEASDVANAVFDGTDAVMLSAETAMGRYPVEAVRGIDRLVPAAEEGSARRD